jgi:hypothetical protein
MKKVKIFGASLCLMLLSTQAFSQVTEKMKSENVVAGSIIKNGKEIPGYIRAMGTASVDGTQFTAPWEFQLSLRFIEKNDFEKAEKIKNKDYVKYEAKDIEGYKYDNDSLIYESVKYSDMSAVGTGMLSQKIFMRKISEGKISLYHHFQSPPPVMVGDAVSFKATYIENANPNYVYKTANDDKLKLVNSLNIKKELSDCPVVVEKFEKGEYGIKNGEGKSTGLTKLMNKTVLKDDIKLAAIGDYNNTCQ